MTEENSTLSLEIAQALSRFAAKQGRSWKAALRAAWSKGEDDRLPDGALLRQFRNTGGLLQLDRISVMPAEVRRVGRLCKTSMERRTAARVYMGSAYRVVLDEDRDIDLFQPWADTRKEAREVCAQMGYLLIE